jgi:hypothetical protein
MIKKAFAAMALAALTISAQAAVVINEGFGSVPALAGSGWIFRNASTPGGDTAGWYQGTSSVFGAQAGGITSYAAANYANTGENGSIDSWLITPEFDTRYGATVSFYLRAAGEGYADQINFGFINADGSLTSSALSAINPVPDSGWTLYSAWIGADTLASARFAFQYTGTYDSANYVGLDSVSVDVPEPASIALLAGGLLGLGAMRRRSRR